MTLNNSAYSYTFVLVFVVDILHKKRLISLCMIETSIRKRMLLRIDTGFLVTMRRFETCFVTFLYISHCITIYILNTLQVRRYMMVGGDTMTMREIAAELGVSIPTLYRRLKAAGIDIRGLRDDKTNKVTPAGAAAIADLFGSPEDDTAVQDIITAASQSDTGEALQDVTALLVRLATAEAKAEAAADTVTRLDNEVRRLQAEVDRLTGLLEAEARTRQALLTDGGQRQRRGLFGFLRRQPGGDVSKQG